jgi:hypothetical protein
MNYSGKKLIYPTIQTKLNLAEKFFTTGDKKVILKPVEDLVMVKYSKSVGNEKTSF